MTVKQLLDVIDKKTMVEVRGEHDCELIFSTNRNCGYYTKDTFEKIKENTVTQITALEEDLIVIYIDSEIWMEYSIEMSIFEKEGDWINGKM
jgi:hypothetical protein